MFSLNLLNSMTKYIWHYVKTTVFRIPENKLGFKLYQIINQFWP